MATLASDHFYKILFLSLQDHLKEKKIIECSYYCVNSYQLVSFGLSSFPEEQETRPHKQEALRLWNWGETDLTTESIATQRLLDSLGELSAVNQWNAVQLLVMEVH